MQQRLIPSTLILLLLLSAAARVPAQGGATEQQRLLTLDDIYDPIKKVNFSGSPPVNLQWLGDGMHYLQSKREDGGSGGSGGGGGGGGGSASLSQLYKVNHVTGEATPFYDAAKMEATLLKISGISAEDAGKLARQNSYLMNTANTHALLNHNHDLFVYEFGSDRVTRLTENTDDEVGEEWSPDARTISFVRRNNLYVTDLATRRERALTSDGAPKLLNGRLNWIYQEEIYGRGDFKGYWWSPDSKRIVYLQLDEASVPEFAVVDHISTRQNLENTPYPKAGDPNPTAKLGIVSLDGSGSTEWIDLRRYQPNDLLIVRVAWTPDGNRVVYQAQNREQTFLDVNFADPRTGRSTNTIRETSRAWVEVIDNPRWLADGSFLWLSERTGYKHLYHYTGEGKLIRQITDGNWEVRTLHGVDQSKGLIYWSGTEHSHIAPHAYGINLDGTGLTRITDREGTHRVEFNSSLTHFIDYWSDTNTPPQVRLYSAGGKLARTIDANKSEALQRYKLGRTEFMQVKTRDGFTMEAMMIKPPNFDPGKKYPVMSHTYSGPQSPSVRNAWGGATYLWHQMLAQQGYIIWICDNRTASGKGVQSTWGLYRNFGELELRDLQDGLAYLRGQSFVDSTRIGLWGWSYGGFMTSYALTHSQDFRIGIAGGSVTDWRLYDSIYTERYMGTPQNNPEGYKRSAPLAAAANLHGKLLLLHGTLDDNVHMQNTIQFAYELQKAGKPFELMLYPKSQHGVTDPMLVKHMRGLMTDFIVRNL